MFHALNGLIDETINEKKECSLFVVCEITSFENYETRNVEDERESLGALTDSYVKGDYLMLEDRQESVSPIELKK